MPVVEVTVAGSARPAVGLRDRLRAETAGWHSRVEAVADLPASVATRDDYVDLLGRLIDLHAGFEIHLAAPAFDSGWRRVGVDIGHHARAFMLAADLQELGLTAKPQWVPSLPLLTFGRALGCLYVLEGSSLGGRTVARVVQAAIGDVPTTFLTGHGRPFVASWVSVCSALALFDTLGGDGDAVVAGACDTFAAFAEHLSRAPKSDLSAAAALG
jgi:heme oxygenase